MDSEVSRIEKDSLGEIAVPQGALYGAQTERARRNFAFSSLRFPRTFISALGLIKGSAAKVNSGLGRLDTGLAEAIAAAAAEVEQGTHDLQFPLDVFQTGSGTSMNMNANEVIATLASSRTRQRVHPNDHVNLGQSSNDVIPTAIHISAARSAGDRAIPALRNLSIACSSRADRLAHLVKTGRTHLMDAVPLTFAQEISGWQFQVEASLMRLEFALGGVLELAIGGTAIGTGLNAHPAFGSFMAKEIANRTKLPFVPSPNLFAAIATQDPVLALSSQLRGAAIAMMKIANDVRWMNSGPISGIGEISVPAIQPGSSIMPGKANPVIAEAVTMLCASVIGNDSTIATAAQYSNFQLNTMLPLVAHKVLESIEFVAEAAAALATGVIPEFEVNDGRISDALARNPILATALVPRLGYDAVAKITNEARRSGRPIAEVAKEQSSLSPEEIDELLNPLQMAHPHSATRHE